MDLYLDMLTKKHMEDIYNHSYQRYRKGKIKRRPSRSNIVRALINERYDSMVEEGEIEG